jgi:hypothetical protein
MIWKEYIREKSATIVWDFHYMQHIFDNEYAEEDIWTEEEWCERRVEKTA